MHFLWSSRDEKLLCLSNHSNLTDCGQGGKYNNYECYYGMFQKAIWISIVTAATVWHAISETANETQNWNSA